MAVDLCLVFFVLGGHSYAVVNNLLLSSVLCSTEDFCRFTNGLNLSPYTTVKFLKAI